MLYLGAGKPYEVQKRNGNRRALPSPVSPTGSPMWDVRIGKLSALSSSPKILNTQIWSPICIHTVLVA